MTTLTKLISLVPLLLAFACTPQPPREPPRELLGCNDPRVARATSAFYQDADVLAVQTIERTSHKRGVEERVVHGASIRLDVTDIEPSLAAHALRCHAREHAARADAQRARPFDPVLADDEGDLQIDARRDGQHLVIEIKTDRVDDARRVLNRANVLSSPAGRAARRLEADRRASEEPARGSDG